jgi:hypothetical protein
MNIEKMRQAAYETAIENEDELFADGDKTPLAMAAALVLKQVPELLATVTQVTAKVALEAAKEVPAADDEDAYDNWQELFTSKLQAGGEVDELLKALAFTTRYVDGIAMSAALKMAAGAKLDENFGAKFGRN